MMRQSQSSVLPESGKTRNRQARIDALWPMAIGGVAALVVSGFMMVSHAPSQMEHQQHSITQLNQGQS
jgi:hypothetical protein